MSLLLLLPLPDALLPLLLQDGAHTALLVVAWIVRYCCTKASAASKAASAVEVCCTRAFAMAAFAVEVVGCTTIATIMDSALRASGKASMVPCGEPFRR